MSCMMEENIKVFVSPEREEAIQLLVILPFQLSPLFFRKFLYFTAKIQVHDSTKREPKLVQIRSL